MISIRPKICAGKRPSVEEGEEKSIKPPSKRKALRDKHHQQGKGIFPKGIFILFFGFLFFFSPSLILKVLQQQADLQNSWNCFKFPGNERNIMRLSIIDKLCVDCQLLIVDTMI